MVSAAILGEGYSESWQEPLDILDGEPVDAPVVEAVHNLVKVPEDYFPRSTHHNQLCFHHHHHL